MAWQRRQPAFYQAVVSRGHESTRLEWVVDSDFRFFPAVRDAIFGYVLHPIDLATNKAMAAAGRREPRDIVDLVMIHRDILPAGAVLWAAAEKALGFTPEGLIDEIRRLARYSTIDFERVASDPPVDPVAVMKELKIALDGAENFVAQMPTDKIGLLFIKDGDIVQPDPRHLGRLYDSRRCPTGSLAVLLANWFGDAGALWQAVTVTWPCPATP